MSLLVLAGEKCEKLMGRIIVNVPVKDVECDEIWAFVAKKEGHKTIEEANNEGLGDAYCFVAIERNTKLVLNFALGCRNQTTTDVFIEALRHATAHNHFQVTTDGFGPYRSAIVNTLHDRCDFAQCIKVYRSPQGGEARYSPAEVASMEVVPVMGEPDPKRIGTSIVERQNLTIRAQMRRLTRLTNAFSKKWENLWAAYCLHFAFYNLCRIHATNRVTPALESGLMSSGTRKTYPAVVVTLTALGAHMITISAIKMEATGHDAEPLNWIRKVDLLKLTREKRNV